jgi:two-component system chemotaxis sensor kinase CheA
MKSNEDEIKEIFLSEALEQNEQLNKCFIELEKNHSDKDVVNSIFRITHTLKANAAGMGFDDIAALSHVLEDVFSEIKNNRIELNSELFNDLFRAMDVLSKLIQAIATPGEKVSYRGIKAKLEIKLNEIRNQQSPATAPDASEEEILSQGTASRPVPASDFSHLYNGEESEVEVLEKEEETTRITFSDNINIPIRKLDNLLNLVGELLIEKDRVIALGTDTQNKRGVNEFTRLQRITSELQYSVMDVRLVQVSVLFSKFHRIVRDTAALENKKVDLLLEGTENEIDRNILQTISDSLIHLVRNSISHGIESEDERIAQGKPARGTVRLMARSEKDSIVIEITDDGRGINPEVIKKKAIEKKLISEEMAAFMSSDDLIQLIFEPGFSSAEKITAVSGRGVGMDVVKRSIDSIGGSVFVTSFAGEGTTISLSLPSSMAVKAALLFESGHSGYAIPLSYTNSVVSMHKEVIHRVGGGLITQHLNKNVTVVFLNDLFALENESVQLGDGVLQRSFEEIDTTTKLNIIIVSHNNREIGLVVDKLLQQKEIVEKKMHPPLDKLKFVSGATILGNGNVCLVIDIPSIVNFLFKTNKMTANNE